MKADREFQALLPDPWPGSHFIGEEETQAVMNVLCSRSLSRFMGPDVQGFAQRLEAWYSAFLGRKYTIAVSSGSTALTVCLSALDIGPGDEVLVPGYAWAACYNVIVRAGAIPRLVEIDETLTMDPNDLVQKISPHSRAVLLVHMNGGCGDVQHIVDLCKEHGLLLIEDVCQANGGKFNGRPLGSFGDMAVFSFRMNKTITSGEGGLISCGDEMLWRRAWMCHDHGYWHSPSKVHTTSNPSKESWWGLGARMSELTASVALAQAGKLQEIVHAMQAHQRILYERLANLPGVQFRPGTATENDIGNWLVLIWPDKARCEAIVCKTREAGVCTISGFGNLMLTEMGLHLYYNNLSLVNKIPTHSSGRPWNDPLNNFASDYYYGKGALPRTDQLLERTQLLYVSSVLTDEAIGKIVDIFYMSVD